MNGLLWELVNSDQRLTKNDCAEFFPSSIDKLELDFSTISLACWYRPEWSDFHHGAVERRASWPTLNVEALAS